MKSESPICRLLLLFITLLINLTTGELEFYQDVEPERSENVNFKNLKRMLEIANSQHESHDTRAKSYPYPVTYEDIFSNDKQKTILQILLENSEILKTLQKNNFNKINHHQRPEYNILNEYPRPIVEREHTHVNLGSPSKFYEYPNVNIPYPQSNVNEEVYFSHDNHVPARAAYSRWKNLGLNIPDNSLIDVQDAVIDPYISKLSGPMEPNRVPNLSHKWNEPEFSYKFDEPLMNIPNTFAIKPNNPRYYESDLSGSRIDKQIVPNNHYLNTAPVQNEKKTMDVDNSKIISHLDQRETMNNKFSNYRVMVPEPQRRTDHDVIATSTSYKANNDAYFIAVVAGCSAAAMFALVLISLTWCRLQRDAKAAADIDYPAYGVTGPNKDISPSGDQRLAHSAQMYHFQHQKQQIIAMEKTPATREPGSVSEAESDEENEEGDYTVYECPGLAPAGEMEVKNPLFSDDPTPTTPSHNNKDMDHSKQ